MDQIQEVRAGEETRNDGSFGPRNWGVKLPQMDRHKGRGWLMGGPRSLGLEVSAVSSLLDTQLDTEAWRSERGLGWKGGPGEARQTDKNREASTGPGGPATAAAGDDEEL